MKKFRKAIVALLAMVMVLGCLTIPASAADGVDNGAYYVIGTMNGWSTNNPSAMTKNGTVYTYEYDLTVAGAVEFKICERASANAEDWDDIGYTFKCDGAPNDGNFAKTADQAGTVIITFDTSKLDKSKWWDASPAVTITGTAFEVEPETAYYVAGSEALCGTSFKENDPNNKMTDNGDGTWSKTYTSVATGDYKFKVTDGTWTNSWPGSDYEFTVSTACDVTITFNESTKEVKATGTGFGTPTLEVEKITVAGTANICGTEYNPGLAANDMTANGKVYTKTYTDLAKGDYEIKFVANGSYDVANWGGTFETSGEEAEAVYNASGNIGFEITYTEATVALEFDLTNYDHSTRKGATFTITITDTTPKTDDKDKDTDTDNKSNVVIVTEEEAKAVKDSIKVEGTKETLVVSTVAKDVADLKVVEAALANKLKDVKYVVADLKFESGNQPTKDTKVTIDISKIAAVKDAKRVSVYRVDNRELKLVDTVDVKEGKITFTPDHFSTYVFAETTVVAPPAGVNATVVIVSAVVMLAAATVIVASKKRVTE